MQTSVTSCGWGCIFLNAPLLVCQTAGMPEIIVTDVHCREGKLLLEFVASTATKHIFKVFIAKRPINKQVLKRKKRKIFYNFCKLFLDIHNGFQILFITTGLTSLLRCRRGNNTYKKNIFHGKAACLIICLHNFQLNFELRQASMAPHWFNSRLIY